MKKKFDMAVTEKRAAYMKKLLIIKPERKEEAVWTGESR